MKKQNDWYSYKSVVSSKYGIKWKIAISNYWKERKKKDKEKEVKGWADSKPKDFQYKIVDGKIVDVRNDVLLAHISPKV
jgi:hypothetical protein